VLERRGHPPPPREFLDAIAGWALAQSRLPLRRGGLGLPAAADVSPAAYLGGMVVTASFLARDSGTALPYDGESFSAALASSELPHCVQTQHAWADCAAAIIAQSADDMAVTLEEVIGCASLSRLHTAKRRAQTLSQRPYARETRYGSIDRILDEGGVN
jgi:hypothetical protein